jgi:hypothetical protein
MNIRYIALFGFACMSLFIMAAKSGPSSSGAPPSFTGAPDEGTCAVSGCHDDNHVNSGPARVTILLNGAANTAYEPGKTYQLKVRITDNDVVRFGYQVVALNESNKNAGNFQVIDPEKTQLENNAYKLLDRKYVTYTFNGTSAIQPGLNEWEVNWTAPVSYKGDVVFYVGAVSANDDETDKGDHVYLANLKIQAKK